MKSCIAFFGTIKDNKKIDAIHINDNIFFEFNVVPNLYFVTGRGFANKGISRINFMAKVNSKFENVDDLNCLFVEDIQIPNKNILVQTSMFFFGDKSYIVIGFQNSYTINIDNMISHVLNVMHPYYGYFKSNITIDPIAYALGNNSYTPSILGKILNRKQIDLDKFWSRNFFKSKDGLIRDVYAINILNNNQINSVLSNKISLKEYILHEKIGVIYPMQSDLWIWDLTDPAHFKKAILLKSDLGNDIFLNA
jgi:hypothetical protein